MGNDAPERWETTTPSEDVQIRIAALNAAVAFHSRLTEHKSNIYVNGGGFGFAFADGTEDDVIQTARNFAAFLADDQ